MEKTFYLQQNFKEILFGNDTELLPSVTELFELEMAHLEYHQLSKDELIERGAFFKKIFGNATKHFLTYSHKNEALSKNRSALTKSYFENGQFSTGYASHSLFPYRGKFHPQLIKGLLNIIGIKKGELVLDPMCGSGTANIEASLMGINSYAVDVSPFCQLMTKTKYEALKINKKLLKDILDKSDALFNFFNSRDALLKVKEINDVEKAKVYYLSFLAFLDSMGYSKRVKTSTHRELFDKVLNRYINTILDFINNPHYNQSNLGRTEVLEKSTALNLEIKDNSIDGVITSPPYSFAIDYVKNDQDQLEFLGYNIQELKSNMVGLIGKNKDERLENYFKDMSKVCSEVYRVLKPNKYFIIIIGSNTNQTGGIRLEQKIIDTCNQLGMPLVKSIIKPIKGMRNTMKDEYVLFFKKN
jgi:DNA modification methylase